MSGTSTICYCREFDSLKTIRKSLDSEAQTERLIQWLALGPNNTACQSCTRQRGSTALLILNAIREACQPFLDKQYLQHQENRVSPTTSEHPVPQPSYNDDFPALGAATATPGNNSNNSKKETKQKRRIRPAVVAPVHAKGNLVGLPTTTEPLNPTAKAWKPAVSNANASTMSSIHTLVTPKKNQQQPKQELSSDVAFQSPRKSSPLSVKTSDILDDDRVFQNLTSTKGLIGLYSNLILNCMVPSTALELDFLVHLVNLPPTSSNATIQSKPTTAATNAAADDGLHSMLSNAERCQYMGREILLRQAFAIRRMGTGIVQRVVECPPIRRQCPALIQELQSILQQEPPTEGTNVLLARQQTALLTLPFQKERDSRHNYKTEEERAVYQNREETRDSFLFQLRSFLKVRGKVLDSVQSDLEMRKIQDSSRRIVDAVSDVNLPWFAEFFSDMLLQIGLVPLEETDKDLLLIANKEKLQKLHQRFSAKAGQSSRNVRQVLGVPKNESATATPVMDAQQYFPGHQEFFFLFLMAADSYRFSVHLKKRLVTILKTSTAGMTPRNLEQRVIEACLVGRFLGLLVFSPHWIKNRSRDQSLVDQSYGLLELVALGISVPESAVQAWKEGRLIAFIPWVVDLLKLSVWDATTMRSRGFLDIAATLVCIRNKQCLPNMQTKYSPVMVIINLTLETFFGDVIGLSRMPQGGEPSMRLCERTMINNSLDSGVQALSDEVVFMANGHVEALSNHLVRLSRSDLQSLKSPGVSRKLRPSSISSSPRSSPVSPLFVSQSSSLSFDHEATGQTSQIRRKLRDAFFHQHQDLREICDWVSLYAWKKALASVLPECIEPSMAIMTLPDLDSPQEIEKLLLSCRSFLGDRMRKTVGEVIAAVSAPSVKAKVRDIAASLTVDDALLSANERCMPIIAAAVAKAKVQHTVSSGKRLFAKELSTQANEPSGLVTVCQLFAKIRENVQGMANITKLLGNLREELEALNQSSRTRIPPGDELRRFFESVLQSDDCFSHLIARVLDDGISPGERWVIARDVMKIGLLVSRLSRHGLASLKRDAADPGFINLLVDLGTQTDHADELASLVNDFLGARWMKTDVLDALLANRIAGEKGGDPLVEFCRVILRNSKNSSMKLLRQQLEG